MYDQTVWLADGNPIVISELGKMPMVEYYALLNKKIEQLKRVAADNKKWHGRK